ncbi:hypothetical protein OHB49_42725 (plasmid) [Streptomyces sp. NBC_01717]|uniref:hypothetical protein n=1 Tax=Streptomyces sp. NBC_01717 TaxID=2975918 RepID=UPI002E337F6E|nr:hypothetical protein [Streptomyces sp. NBC_01717]
MLAINVAMLLAVVVFLWLRRRAGARSRFDEKLTVVIMLALVELLVPFGRELLGVMGQLVGGVSASGW